MGAWSPPPSKFYMLLGPTTAVALFFMVTGFLFWTQVLSRRGKLDCFELYIGRVFRIGPLYLTAVAVLLALVATRTDFQLNSTPLQLARQVAEWGALGFFSGTAVNGYAATSILIARVTWTLRYEWLFYFSLPLTSLVARIPWGAGVLPAVSWVAALVATAVLQARHHDASDVVYVAEFAAGMFCAFLKASLPSLPRSGNLLSSLAAALLAIVLWRGDSSYSIATVVLLTGAFASITQGATLFGLLTTRSARRLGDISFGVYLLQGLVLSTFFDFAPAREWALKGPLPHWTLMTICALLLVGVATLTHVLVERPGMLAGKRLIDRRQRRVDPSETALGVSRPTP